MSSFSAGLASFASATFTPDQLIVNSAQLVTRKITILSGNVIVRGAVLGKITSSGKYILSLSAASDGSQVPDCIAAIAVDATAGDVEELGYFRGQFNSNAITLGTGQTVAAIREGLRAKGVDLIDVIPA